MTEQQADQMIALLQETSGKLDELHSIVVNLQWVCAAVMFVAGFLPIIAFFLGKGDK